MIELIDVHFAYQSGVEVLKGVSLEIRKGEVVAIMGENGAGKTTLLKHLNGLLKPNRGTVLVDGVDTRSATTAELARKVGVVFQSPDHMFFLNTVEEEVAFALRNFGYEEEVVEMKVRKVLEFMGLEKYRERSPFSLSGGEKKRLSIAIALAWDPDYLVIDEPTVGQDEPSKRRLAELIKELAEGGKAIIISTHDVEFVADLRPRVVVMSKGKVVADGRAEDVLTNESAILKASLLMPQVPLLMKRLADLGVSQKILSIEEAVEELVRVARR